MVGQGLGNAFDIQGWSGVLQPAVSLKDKGQKITIRNTMEPKLCKFVRPSSLYFVTLFDGRLPQGQGP